MIVPPRLSVAKISNTDGSKQIDVVAATRSISPEEKVSAAQSIIAVAV